MSPAEINGIALLATHDELLNNRVEQLKTLRGRGVETRADIMEMPRRIRAVVKEDALGRDAPTASVLKSACRANGE